MNDKPTSTDAAWVSVVRDRRADLLRDRDLIEARLAELNELLALIETPAATVRRPRQQARATTTPVEPVPALDPLIEGDGVV